jgi:predicted Rossmann fold flavoprotein
VPQKNDRNFDVVIVGAGAAGLMCAIEAGKRGRRVALLDHAGRAGKKILISGGGRCNFTNLHCKPENFLSANPHFAKSALARFTPGDFLALVEKHNISYHEKKLGQLFCDHSALQIVDMLLAEAKDANVQLFLNETVSEVRRDSAFTLNTNSGGFHSAALVIATGGLSIPKMGATGFGYDVARQFGLKIVDPWPALVPFVLNRQDQKLYCDLAGVASDVIASVNGIRFEEKLLVTHRGLSGPAILQISSYWKPGAALRLDLAPRQQVLLPLFEANARRELNTVRIAMRAALPHRLADRILEIAPPPAWNNHAIEAWERQLHDWPLTPQTTEGYEKAEVTAGGIDTAELSAKTMESRIPGLFFIGEVVDVTGHLGGFNFQWAWASGAAAGRSL